VFSRLSEHWRFEEVNLRSAFKTEEGAGEMNSSARWKKAGRLAQNMAKGYLFLIAWVFVSLAANGTAKEAKQTPSDQPASSGITWSIEPPVTPWNITDHNWTEFVVTLPATSTISNLRIARSTIVDSDAGRGKTLSAQEFHICIAVPTAKIDCNENTVAEKVKKLKEDAATAKVASIRLTLLLMVDVDKDAVPDGTYSGNLYVDAEPLTDTKTLQLTINRTTHSAKVRGVLVIAAGVVLAWFVTVLARSRINRDQVLLPVEVLRQKLSALEAQLAAIQSSLKPDISNTLQKITDVLNDLSMSSLDDQQLLPPSLPLWGQSTTQAAAFQTFIQARAQIVDNLNVIATGIQQAANLATTIPPGRLPDLHGLVQKIDQFATILPQTSATLQTQIKALFDAWNATPQAQALGADGSTQLLAMPTASPVGIYRIRMEIQTITLLFWVVWGALSILIGFSTLIMTAPGFGTAADYVRCAIWGFGLPVAGQGLQTLTMSSLNTQLGVTLPK
jgi:hypothetical protein